MKTCPNNPKHLVQTEQLRTDYTYDYCTHCQEDVSWLAKNKNLTWNESTGIWVQSVKIESTNLELVLEDRKSSVYFPPALERPAPLPPASLGEPLGGFKEDLKELILGLKLAVYCGGTILTIYYLVEFIFIYLISIKVV